MTDSLPSRPLRPGAASQLRRGFRGEHSPAVSMAIIAGLVAAGLVAACSSESRTVNVGQETGEGFGNADSGADGAADSDVDASLSEPVAMCPVTTCTLPWANCPSSEFPCSTNLLSDDNNCGGCGIRCAGKAYSAARWSCVDGKCQMSCEPYLFDCDGNYDNGCETYIAGNVNHCGACGVKCADGLVCHLGQCVDLCAMSRLPDSCDGQCTNMDTDAKNCGACGNLCDPADPALKPLPPDMYYGCGDGKCGAPTCRERPKADCNENLSDGCESTLHTNEHCNGCNDSCPVGKPCRKLSGEIWTCGCDDRSELCDGICKQVDDDPLNCGACDRVCPGILLPDYQATCARGTCGGKCRDGYIDCDEMFSNGCEINSLVDNRNCGACGHACLVDQVCFNGKCLEAPCDAGAGDPTK